MGQAEFSCVWAPAGPVHFAAGTLLHVAGGILLHDMSLRAYLFLSIT